MQRVENKIVRMVLREFEKCCPYAKIVPRKNFRNSGKRPFFIANARKRAPWGVLRALYKRVGLTQKNFFCQKMPVLEEKVGWVDFLREKNYRKSTLQLTDI